MRHFPKTPTILLTALLSSTMLLSAACNDFRRLNAIGRHKQHNKNNTEDLPKCEISAFEAPRVTLPQQKLWFAVKANEYCGELTLSTDSEHASVSDQSHNIVKVEAPSANQDFDIDLVATEKDGTTHNLVLKMSTKEKVAIIKTDDVKYVKDGDSIIGGFEYIFQEAIKRDISVSAGVIGNSLTEGGTEYAELLKKYWSDEHVELWNHGYDHNCSMPGGKWEFMRTDLDYQIKHMTATQDLAISKLGRPFKAFGAPCNANDKNTAEAFKKNKDLKLFMLEKDSSKDFLNLNERVEAELNGGPDLETTKASFEINHVGDSFIIQVHPRAWTKEEAKSFFDKNIAFLASKNVGFVTPSEYYWLHRTQDELISDLQ